MKNYLAFSVCFVAYFLAAGKFIEGSKIHLEAQGGAECDTKELKAASCKEKIPGCTSMTWQKCMPGTAGERNHLCNAGQGNLVCNAHNPNNYCSGANQDDLSTEVCTKPKVIVDP